MPVVALVGLPRLAGPELALLDQSLQLLHQHLHGLIVLLRELLPNVLLPLLAFFLLGVAVTIVVEGALSFLGLGVPPPRKIVWILRPQMRGSASSRSVSNASTYSRCGTSPRASCELKSQYGHLRTHQGMCT